MLLNLNPVLSTGRDQTLFNVIKGSIQRHFQALLPETKKGDSISMLSPFTIF